MSFHVESFDDNNGSGTDSIISNGGTSTSFRSNDSFDGGIANGSCTDANNESTDENTDEGLSFRFDQRE